jgi:D-sedoheptulose 7-phosphate isomerase
MKSVILNILEDSVSVKRRSIESSLSDIIKAAEMLAACVSAGNKILIFGNGGSAADSQHLAAEFINRFQIERPPLAAIALTTDSSILTSIANDDSFNNIFSKQVEALGKPGDVAWAISTSGNSPNVIRAVQTARRQKMATIAMTGRGGELAGWADLVFSVDSETTARIQETHITIGHILCDLTERILYPQQFNDT